MALAQVLSIRTEPAPSPQTICDYKYCNCIFDGDEALHFHNISTNHDLIDLINDPNVRFALRVPEAEGRPTTIDEISSDPTLLNEDSQAGYKWSTTTPENYEFVLKALVDHCHAVDTLLENEYRITPHTTEEINDIQRCINCKSESTKAYNIPNVSVNN